MCLTPNIDPVDWQTGKAPLECTKHILEEELNCDVNFKVGENEENIKAHKLILSMRSAVFDRMFNGGFEEAEKDPVIPDVTVGAFRTLLRYCYYECLDVDEDVALSVLYASTKYMLPILEEAARKKLIEILNGSNIWDIYKYAISVGDTELYERSKGYFVGSVKGVREALQTEEFLNIPHEVLLEFLHINDEDKALDLDENPDTDDCDPTKEKEGDDGIAEEDGKEEEVNENDILHDKDGTLDMNENDGHSKSTNPDVEEGGERTEEEKDDEGEGGVIYENSAELSGISISEIELFKACNAWAEAECLRQEIDPTGANKRTVLGECLFLIRFPTMLRKDLLAIVYPPGILTQTELANLGEYMYNDLGSECQVDFPSKKRTFVVTSPGLFMTGKRSTLYVESEVQVLLTKVWITGYGSYRVTVRNETSEESWSMKYDVQDQSNCTEGIDNINYILGFIDITPQVLKPGTRYSVTTEKTRSMEDVRETERPKWVIIRQEVSLKEVKITQDRCAKSSIGVDNAIYALTLCLV